MGSEMISFQLRTASSTSRARTGALKIARGIDILTPALWAHTSRGAVPHLTRDHVERTPVHGIHIALESYLENKPPTPMLQPGTSPWHTFHGFRPEKYVLSFGLRDPDDVRAMPANGNKYVVATCAKGAKQVVPADFIAVANALQPDIIYSLPDIPYTPAPYSQKRLTKSNERTIRWLRDLIVSRASMAPSSVVFVHLLGGAVGAARAAFANSLLEPLEDTDAAPIPLVPHLDVAVSGYILDLLPIRLASLMTPSEPLPSSMISSLLQASLKSLPSEKPRLINGARSPQEILRCISDVGADIFDSAWAQTCADHGVALDFTFPAPPNALTTSGSRCLAAHNLYDETYSLDFRRLADSLVSAQDASSIVEASQFVAPTCPCLACSPGPCTPLRHSVIDETHENDQSEIAPPFTRSYIHHLLQTHEMSAHTLLASHNICVLAEFFVGVRDTLVQDSAEPTAGIFRAEVQTFLDAYDEEALCGKGGLLDKASQDWAVVEGLRGKGRLKREKIEAAAAVIVAETL